jgi:hypothetical protein
LVVHGFLGEFGIQPVRKFDQSHALCGKEFKSFNTTKLRKMLSNNRL